MKAINYMTHTLFERNADNGLAAFETLEDALADVESSLSCGATQVRLFRCAQMGFETETVVRVVPCTIRRSGEPS